MNNKLFVTSIEWKTTEQELWDFFSQFWTVTESKIIMDRETWRPRWFWFVTLETEEEAANAVENWNWKELNWRELIVNIAQDRK